MDRRTTRPNRFADKASSDLSTSPQHSSSAHRLALLVADVVDVHLDVSPLRSEDPVARGNPSVEPRLMVGILFYGYLTGVRSSRLIARACVDDPRFQWLAGGSTPNHRVITQFRTRYRIALEDLFAQALALCRDAGMARVGEISLIEPRTRSVSELVADTDRVYLPEDTGRSRRRGVRRALLGAVLVASTIGGGYTVAMHQTVTLVVDGSPMTVSTLESTVLDVVRDNGFT